VGAAIASICATFFSFLAIRIATSVLGRERAAELVPLVNSEEHQRCLRSPATYSYQARGVAIDAFDVQTGASSRAGVERLSLEDLETLRRDGFVWRTYQRSKLAAELLQPVGNGGPCSVFRCRIDSGATYRRAIPIAALFGLLLACALASFLSLRFSVRRLHAHINQLAHNAKNVGTGPTTTLPTLAADDPFQIIASALEQSHARIISSQTQLAERTETLEKHLVAVAHDLRTPLASLQLTIDRAKDGDPEALDAMHEDVAMLTALAENLRLAAMFSQSIGTSKTEVCDLRQLVESLGKRTQRLGHRRKIEVAFALPDDPMLVTCNPIAVLQAFSNLAQNSLRHARTHIALVLEARANDSFRFMVRDDGDGFELPERLSLKDALTAKSRSQTGFGLGLPITREVVDAHRWTLQASRQEGAMEVAIVGARTAPTSTAHAQPSRTHWFDSVT
jgi:signal transduction histidine kinase